MLRADLHIHTSFSPDGQASPQDVVARCLEVDLSCIAITDHNTIAGALEAQRNASIHIIVGEEVMAREGEVMGLFLKEEVPRGLSALETMEAIKEQGALVCIPHPFDRFRSGLLRRAPWEELLPLVDMVEVYNARTFLPGDNRMAQEFAERHGLVATVGSDAHAPGELGRTYLEMPDFDDTAQGFMRSLRSARLVRRRANPLYRLSSTCERLRGLLRHA